MEKRIEIIVDGYIKDDGSMEPVKIPRLNSSKTFLLINSVTVEVPELMYRSQDRFKHFETVWRMKCNFVKSGILRVETDEFGRMRCSEGQGLPFDQIPIVNSTLAKFTLMFKEPYIPLTLYEPDFPKKFEMDPSIQLGGDLTFNFQDERSYGKINGFHVKINVTLILEY